MRPAMVLIYILSLLSSMGAQNESQMIAYSGVYKGEPLFIQNPYLPSSKSYCITDIYVNGKRVDIVYNRSALLLDFKQVQKFSPVSIRINYSDSLCVPVLLNPDAIKYHSVFSFEAIAISDSSVVWTSKGEQPTGEYGVERFYLGDWETLKTLSSDGIYGGSDYTFFPIYEEGSNKYRIKYSDGDLTLYSEEVEHVFYPEPITYERKGAHIVLSRSSEYIVTDLDNNELIVGSGKEFKIDHLKNGQYYFVFGEEQIELYRKNDPVVVIRNREKGNN